MHSLTRIFSRQPERISGDPYTVKSDVWSLGITLVELAIGRFPFSAEDEPASSGEDEAEDALARLSFADEAEDRLDELGDDTLSPVRPDKKRESIMLAERQRKAKRESMLPGGGGAARTRKASGNGTTKAKRKPASATATGVSLSGSGHQMSILELLQYIVNEPAPRLPAGKFSPMVEDFVDATLRKEPVGWDVKKKGPLPADVARPTPKELLVSCPASLPCVGRVLTWLGTRQEYPWMKHTAVADTDVRAFARSIPT